MPRTSIPQRGVAMLLVLISLAVATIATSAYIASRDNSAIIGDNVVASSSARAAAVSGLELGIAILETETDWRQSHVDGKLLDDYPLDGGELDIDLVDMVTGMPPTEETSVVELTASARVNGIQQRAVAVATVLGGEGDQAIDPDLSEFGVFAGDKLRMDNDATITRWTTSPLAGMGNPINVGTQSSVAGTIELIGNSAAIDTTVFTPPSPSGSLVQNAAGPVIGIQSLLDTIPMPDPPAPPVAEPAGPQSNLDVNGTTSTVSLDPVVSYSWMRVRTNGELTLQGNAAVTTTALWVMSGGRLLIDGDIDLLIYGDLYAEDGSIELLPGAALRIHVQGNLTVLDSYIGDGPYDPATDMDTTGNARWMDPELLTIYSMPTTTGANWKMQGASVVKGRLYAKNLDYLQLRNTAAFYGNVVANHVLVLDQAAIFYDHTLDAGNGYTRPGSLVYDEFDRILADLLSLASLGDSDLQALADAADVTVTNGTREIKSSSSTSGSEIVPDPPVDITPRPVLVEYDVRSIGSDVRTWEDGA